MNGLDQKGFTLVQAVFILVVLGLLGMVMVRLIGVQTSTGVMALQGARAYHAARSGLEWGAAWASAGKSCSGNMQIDGFDVEVACEDPDSFNEAGLDYVVYNIKATAKYGTYGDVSFVSRSVEMKVGFLRPSP
ncbi:pilus assembly protein MshP [Pelovirga terrestris]|uniref:Pilus assembly protein MshP n=1 Tax=Pelovirga terrestris TaxID=2771352 RepID=A0A8J6QS22_9BACT|nr:pilus assembly protein MshP [Pelovirga terrestris]MBD1401408.1 pilus assembly protein MshP [Pelovirga terrestris]